MASDLQKYRAQILQIAGFAFATPLGKFFLDLKDIKLEELNIWFFLCLLISMASAYFGIILIFEGEDHLI